MRGAACWSGVSVPVVAPSGWSRGELLDGLAELERIRRSADAASAVLTGALGCDSRDAAAAVVRATGCSGRQARHGVKVAEVVGALPFAGAALAAGEISSDHVHALADVADDPEAAAELLASAGLRSPDALGRAVRRHLLGGDQAKVKDAQQAERSVTFFNAGHGNVGMRAVLNPTEGAELRAILEGMADEEWRAQHPDRATAAGGHGGAPLRQRLADALVRLFRGEGSASSARPSIIVVVDEARLEAEVPGSGSGSGPVPFGDVVEMAARADLYAAVRNAKGAIVKFGMSRRLASPLQRLAVIVRDGGRCMVDGCDGSYQWGHAHHVVPFEQGGPTDLENLGMPCGAHHRHVHRNGLRLVRRDGGWVMEPDPLAHPPPGERQAG